MGGIGDETPLLVHHGLYSFEQPVDRSDERMELARGALQGKSAQIVRAPDVQLSSEFSHRPQRLPYDDRDHQHQARRQGCEWQNRMEGAVARDLVADLGGLADGKSAAVRPCPHPETRWLLVAGDNMQTVAKDPERASVGHAARPVAQFLDRYPRLRVDATVGRLIILEAGIERQGPDLGKDRVLHFDRFIERPLETHRACADTRRDDHERKSDQKTSAQGVGHEARSTIQPTPRTLRIATAPSFLRIVWIRNSIALLSTSSFHP